MSATVSAQAELDALAGRRSAKLWWLIAFVLLTLTYVSGVLRSSALPRILGSYPTEVVNRAPHFDNVSEALIENRIDLRFAGIDTRLSEFISTVRKGAAIDPRIFDIERPELYEPNWRPSRADLLTRDFYRSQIGLQGRMYAAASNAMGFDRPRTYLVLRTFNAAMLAATLATLIAAIAATWGRNAGLAALGFCLFATGFNLFSSRLYWATFTHIAPTVVTALFALRLPHRSLTAHAATFAVVTLCFGVRFASGYEFMTVTIAAATLPFFIAFAKRRIAFKPLVVYSAAVVAIGIAAFGVTLGIYEILFRAEFGQSGIAFLQTRTQLTSGPPFVGPLGTPLQMAKVAMINVADVGGYGLPVFVILAAGLPFAWIAVRALVTGDFVEERARIALVVTAALLASTSWMLLQFPHISFHPRYATIVVAFPYGVVLAAALGRLWQMRREARTS